MENLITLLTALIGQTAKVSRLIEVARQQGRDVTEQELDALMADLESSRSNALDAVREARQS